MAAHCQRQPAPQPPPARAGAGFFIAAAAPGNATSAQLCILAGQYPRGYGMRGGVGSTARLVAGAGTLAVLGFGYDVGHTGGQLVYRDGAASAYTTPGGR